MTTDWVTDAVTTISADFSMTNGGRIITSLANTGSPNRQLLANLLAAAVGQRKDTDAAAYLATVAGESATMPTVTEGTTSGIDPKRPVHIRPNGAPYYSRKWGDMWDTDVLIKARDTEQYAMLLGPPGTGKTAMAESAFGADLITTAVTGDTMVSGLVGGYVPDGRGDYRWADGPLLTAAKDGRPIFIDEILLANTTVLSVLYPAMDGRGFIDVQENPEIGIVHTAPGFYVIGAGNPDVPGAKFSDALKSRFPLHTWVTTDWNLAKALGVDATVVEVLEGLETRARSTTSSISWAPQMRELLAFKKAQDTFDRDFAIRNLMRLVPKADLEEVTSIVAPLLGGLSKVIPSKI
ncbi:AAA-ATPase [Microbacterium phage PauloDiaboli]|nr:AAA-ATPase [Microbacterium phage PauloDiaboli]QWY84050.1 AAA-ATPase [Microbacterium phage A3Wally]